MTPDELAAIVARDAAVTPETNCICDAASFWAPDHCAICGHKPDVHGDEPDRCAVRVPRRLSEAEADRRALLTLLRETREALALARIALQGHPELVVEALLRSHATLKSLASLDPP